MADCTLVILTYKGKHHLEYLLPTVSAAIGNYKGSETIDVLIVDNGCDESTRQYSTTNFPGFNYQFSPANDFLFSLNGFVEKITTEYVFILNDDIKLDKDILNNLIPFADTDKSIFAVTCRFLDWDTGESASGVRTVKYSKGWLRSYYLNYEEAEIKYTLYASGGGSLFRTKMFNELGGFDSLFRPGYYEDTDLGIRAWQQKWKVLYMPSAFLYHREGGTMKEYFKNDKRDQMISRNHILWMLKNVRIDGFLFWFFLLLPYRLVYNYLRNRNQYKAFLQAIPHFSQALSKRSEVKPVVADDTKWWGYINKNYSAFKNEAAS